MPKQEIPLTVRKGAVVCADSLSRAEGKCQRNTLGWVPSFRAGNGCKSYGKFVCPTCNHSERIMVMATEEGIASAVQLRTAMGLRPPLQRGGCADRPGRAETLRAGQPLTPPPQRASPKPDPRAAQPSQRPPQRGALVDRPARAEALRAGPPLTPPPCRVASLNRQSPEAGGEFVVMDGGHTCDARTLLRGPFNAPDDAKNVVGMAGGEPVSRSSSPVPLPESQPAKASMFEGKVIFLKDLGHRRSRRYR